MLTLRARHATAAAVLIVAAGSSAASAGIGYKGRKCTPPTGYHIADCRSAKHADGRVNTVTEYDAKAAFGNVVYFNSNTTQVSVGGIARGMVRVGIPAAKVQLRSL